MFKIRTFNSMTADSLLQLYDAAMTKNHFLKDTNKNIFFLRKRWIDIFFKVKIRVLKASNGSHDIPNMIFFSRGDIPTMMTPYNYQLLFPSPRYIY